MRHISLCKPHYKRHIGHARHQAILSITFQSMGIIWNGLDKLTIFYTIERKAVNKAMVGFLREAMRLYRVWDWKVW